MDLSPLLRAHSQVLFSRSPWVGGLLVLATLLEPRVGIAGLVAGAVAWGSARLLQLSPVAIREGVYGYNAVLVGLAAGSMVDRPAPLLVLTTLGAVSAVFATAALQSVRTVLPPLTLPFLAGLWFLSLVTGAPLSAGEGLGQLGALFFVPTWQAGLLVAAAMVAWSRQGTVLALVGLAVAEALAWVLGPPVPAMLRVDLMLVGMAVGVWFVPSRSTLVLAAVGAGLGGLLAYGLDPLFLRLGLPASVLPFNLATWTILLALRMRMVDAHPKAVDTTPGTPEQNLAYHHTRVARFGARYAVRFRLPVLGRWVVTQAEEDGPTHREAWRHALDLEVQTEDGQLHHGRGDHVADYLCYRLPVVATADGTVATLVDGVRDNPVGEVELDDNWGNLVVLYHAPGLYSTVAHLAPGSIEVKLGQRVRQGDVLGRCGASGRAPRPHVHFQLQGSAAVGAPTLPLELHDLVDVSTAQVRSTWSPTTGDELRNLEVDADLAGALALVPGATWSLDEAVTAEVDASGVPYLSDGEGSLVYARRPDLLTFFAPLAGPRSVLHLVRSALPRVPFEPGVSWTDHLSPMQTIPWFLRPFWEVASMFAPWSGIEITYTLARDGEGWTVLGRSADGRISTRAVLDRRGPTLLEVHHDGRCRTTRRPPQESP